jgi:hypothetical protein
MIEVSGQLHAAAALLPWKEPLIPIAYEAGWTPEPIWMFWRRENVLVLPGINSDSASIQPIT